MTRWCILTGELPPECGGVGDYTLQLAAALAARGDRVAVFRSESTSTPPMPPHVAVFTLPDAYGPAGRRQLERHLAEHESRLLVQYVPNAFGCRGLNLPLCHWLLRRARGQGTDVRVMFHEPYLYFAITRPHWNVLATGQRAMAAMLLRASREIYLSTDAWRPYLRRLQPAAGPEPITLPIPSTIPRHASPDRLRARNAMIELTGRPKVVGHFGTYGPEVAGMLRDRLLGLLEADDTVAAACVGAGSRTFVRDLLERHRYLTGRVLAFGRAAAHDAAATLAACDLLLQPYPDGVTTRRTSVMAGLINGCPVVTTLGALTEPVWRASGAVALAAAGDLDRFVRTARQLLSNEAARVDLGTRAEALYRARFDLEHTVSWLHGAPPRGDAA